jgi:hypothetical protein
MIDVQTISIVIASAGVFIAAIYYIFQLRHQNRMRQTDLLTRLASSWKSKEFIEALLKVLNLEFKDYDDFARKYGRPFSDTSIYTALWMVIDCFEEAGILLKRGILDVDLALELLPTALVWKKLESFLMGIGKNLAQELERISNSSTPKCRKENNRQQKSNSLPYSFFYFFGTVFVSVLGRFHSSLRIL